MAYTLELSQKESAILRRIAWAAERPMTVTLSVVVQMAAKYASKDRICEACRDNRFCHECPFKEVEAEIVAGMSEELCPYCGKEIEDLSDYFSDASDPKFNCPHCNQPIQGWEKFQYVLEKHEDRKEEEHA